MEFEFVVVRGGREVDIALQPLRDKGHHVELIQEQGGFMQSLITAFDRAHFSLILVSGDSLFVVSCVRVP